MPHDKLPPEGEERIAAILELVRLCPLLDIVAKVQERGRALHLGPHLHPTIWKPEDITRERSNFNVLNRLEDLRRALIEADEIQARLDASRSYPSNPVIGEQTDEHDRSQ